MIALAFQRGVQDALEKFAMPTPLITAQTIGQEYKALATRYPDLAQRFTTPVNSPVPRERNALLTAMKARLAGPSNPQVLAAHQAELAARSGALQRGGAVKVSAIAPGKLPVARPAAPPAPAAPVTAGKPASQVALKPLRMPTFKAPQPTAAPTLAPPAFAARKTPLGPSAPQQITGASMGAAQGQAVANAQKLGEFSLRGVSSGAAMNPDHLKVVPGQISLDNGRRSLGTSFDLPRKRPGAIDDGFDSLNTQRNSDAMNLNALNEGIVPTVGA